jgi:hypothetical protein
MRPGPFLLRNVPPNVRKTHTPPRQQAPTQAAAGIQSITSSPEPDDTSSPAATVPTVPPAGERDSNPGPVLRDLSSPHWNSEALIPVFEAKTQRVVKFERARLKGERSKLGSKFLERGGKRLLRAGNSVIGLYSVTQVDSNTSVQGCSTAFQVAPNCSVVSEGG